MTRSGVPRWERGSRVALGVGIDAHGNLIYAAADIQTAQSLAQILQHAGAVRAMELDINYEWTTFNFYGTFGAGEPTKLLPGMSRPAIRYLTPTTATSSRSHPVANRRAAACRAAVHIPYAWTAKPGATLQACRSTERELGSSRPGGSVVAVTVVIGRSRRFGRFGLLDRAEGCERRMVAGATDCRDAPE